MYIVTGASWILFWFLVQILHVETLLAVLLTGLVFIVIGFVVGERLNPRNP